MSIRKMKRRDGIVYAVRVMAFGKRIQKTFKRRHDAVQFLQEARHDPRLANSTRFTFEAAANEWLENHARPRKAPGTVRENESLLRLDLIPAFGKRALGDIQPQEIDNLIAKLRQRMSEASANRRLEIIRAVFNYHKRRRNVLYSPMDGVAFLKVDPKPMKFWTLEEARKFLEHAKSKYEGTPQEYVYLLYMLALNTGMRFGELLALKWTAVDFTSGLIMVCRTLCHHTRQIRETTKGRRIRHVPINDSLFHLLETAKARRGESELVLHTGGVLLDENNIRNRHWQVDIRESGVSEIRFHDMRHTYASHFLMNGGELFKLQAILGHADIRTTMNYSHFSKAYLLENANIVRFEATGNVIYAPFKKSGTEE